VTVLTNRLRRLTPELTAKERAVLVLRAVNAGEEPDPEILATMPREQNREFDRYAGLSYVANGELGALCRAIQSQVEGLDAQRLQIEELERAAALLEEEFGLEKQGRLRGWRRKESVTVPEFLRGLALELRDEIVWNEIAQEFDGEDPVHAELRQRAADTGELARSLAFQVGRRRRSLPRPSDEITAEVRDLVDRSFEALGLVKRGA
jgi:hypothetical protein